MDPMTAVALASSIVQFVDFSSKLVSKGHHIYTSANGALSENLDLEAVTVDLSHLTARLKGYEGCTCPTKDQQDLLNLASSCDFLADQLMERLEKLKVDKDAKHRKWKSFRQALKAVWSKKELDDMATSLASFRSQLELHILVSLR